MVLAAELRIITLGFSIFAKLKRTRLGQNSDPKGQQDTGSRNPGVNNQHSEGLHIGDSTQHVLNPLKKILKPFQRNDEEISEVSTLLQRPSMLSGIASQQPAKVSTNNTADIVPSEVYQRVLSENKILREKISALTKAKEEQAASLEKGYRELEEKISGMVHAPITKHFNQNSTTPFQKSNTSASSRSF